MSLAKITNMNLAIIIRTCSPLANTPLNKLADRASTMVYYAYWFDGSYQVAQIIDNVGKISCQGQIHEESFIRHFKREMTI